MRIEFDYYIFNYKEHKIVVRLATENNNNKITKTIVTFIYNIDLIHQFILDYNKYKYDSFIECEEIAKKYIDEL